MKSAISFKSLRAPLFIGAVALAIAAPVALTSQAQAESSEADQDTAEYQAQGQSQGKLSDAIAACGNIQVRSTAKCNVVVDPPACELQCKPISFEAACAAELSIGCNGQCNAQVTMDCQDKCASVCVPQCELNPGNFSCSAQCTAGCNVDCKAKCEAEAQVRPGDARFKSRCESSCGASCKATCSGGCQGELPNVTCKERCGQVCVPECKAKANIGCQIDCQASGFAKCEARLDGGCKAECKSGKGALFCDGQFINTSEIKDGLNNCVKALNGILTAKIDYNASAECDGKGNCSAEAEAGISCDVAPNEKDSDRRWLWGLLVLPGAFAFARRRRAK